MRGRQRRRLNSPEARARPPAPLGRGTTTSGGRPPGARVPTVVPGVKREGAAGPEAAGAGAGPRRPARAQSGGREAPEARPEVEEAGMCIN